MSIEKEIKVNCNFIEKCANPISTKYHYEKIIEQLTNIKIKDVNRNKFLDDRNKFLDECLAEIKKLEFKSLHAPDDTCNRMRVFCLNHINQQIELLKRINAKF